MEVLRAAGLVLRLCDHRVQHCPSRGHCYARAAAAVLIMMPLLGCRSAVWWAPSAWAPRDDVAVRVRAEQLPAGRHSDRGDGAAMAAEHRARRRRSLGLLWQKEPVTDC